jgi:predicted ATPase/class 3 adenylate cyclase
MTRPADGSGDGESLNRNTLAGDNLQAYIAGDRRRALAAGLTLPDRVSGSALFADISGFTPLTEALNAELGAHRGAEELTAILHRVVGAVLEELHGYGGVVIYFSGDAVTAWIDGDDGTLATAAALAMQAVMADVGTVITPGGAVARLAMKVAVSAGDARRFVVGDPRIQLIDVLAGALMDRLAATEHEASAGEVVVDGQTLDLLVDRVHIAEVRAPDGGQRCGVVDRLLRPVATPPPPPPYPPLTAAQIRDWLLPAVYERMRTGRGEFLAELRTAVPFFIRFGGIDYDHDPDARDKLDAFVTSAQRVIDRFGGNVLQLTMGDKGAYLFAVFGAPIAHEDDARRACSAALEVVALEGRTAVTGLQLGLSQGDLHSGTYGHQERRTFCCLGDATNVAARLMSAAPAGSVYVTAAVAAAAGDKFDVEVLPDLALKGKARPAQVRRLLGVRRAAPGAAAAVAEQGLPLVGRDGEVAEILARAEPAFGGAGQVVAVVAEAGMGKSRLLAEVVARLRDRGATTFAGAAQSVGTSASYLAWQPVFWSLFGLRDEQSASAVTERVAARLAAVDPALLERLPLLGSVLGVPLDDNEMTRLFDAKLRKTSLESLLVSYLTSVAAEQPVVLLVEDCHWLDPLSRDLLDLLARAAATCRLIVLLTARPAEDPGDFTVPTAPHIHPIALGRLGEEAATDLITAKVRHLAGPEVRPSDRLVRLVTERAEGNPFYLGELLAFLHDRQVDWSADGGADGVALPGSLSSLVLSRIDTMREAPRRTLKVASVVGREFELSILVGAYPELGSRPGVRGHLRRLSDRALVTLERPEDERYAFAHAVIREVAYGSLTFAVRAVLHTRIAGWIETSAPAQRHLDLLAHHYGQGTDDDKKRTYLLRAADAAAHRYANDDAVGYYRQALPLLAESEAGLVLLRLGAVLELRGDWGEAEAVYSQALDLAERRADAELGARARAARAEAVRKQGDFTAAELTRAEQGFASVGDDAGLGRVAHLRGTIAAQMGEYTQARSHYERSLAIRVGLGDRAGEAALLSNLAIVAEYEGDYLRAQDLNEQALELREGLGDRWAIGVSRNNLGMIAFLRGELGEARRHLEEAVRIELAVGDSWMVAIVNNNLGNTTRDLGDLGAARRHYAEALKTYRLVGDRWALGILFEDVAVMAAAEDPRAALTLLGAAEAVRESIGSPRAPALQAELRERLAPARAALGAEADAVQAAGRGLDIDAACARALAVCGERE